MQRVKACSIILFALVIISAAGTYILTDRCDSLSAEIVTAQELYDSGDKESAMKIIDNLGLKWQSDYRIMSCLVGKDSLEGLNVSIAKLEPFMESDNDELEAEVFSALYQLDLIKQTELPYFWNIL